MLQTLNSDRKLQNTTSGRVVLLIDQKETDLFFPGGLSMPGVQTFAVAGAERDGALDLTLLRSFAPDVVVTSWSTPCLPENTLSIVPSLRYLCHTSGSVRKLVPRILLEQDCS